MRQGLTIRSILRSQRCCWCLEMESGGNALPIVRTGDLDGLGRVYSDTGGLITGTGEEILKATTGGDANVSSPWRRILPKIMFPGVGGEASSKLFLTNKR